MTAPVPKNMDIRPYFSLGNKVDGQRAGRGRRGAPYEEVRFCAVTVSVK
jgi:hypothetical protein